MRIRGKYIRRTGYALAGVFALYAVMPDPFEMTPQQLVDRYKGTDSSWYGPPQYREIAPLIKSAMRLVKEIDPKQADVFDKTLLIVNSAYDSAEHNDHHTLGSFKVLFRMPVITLYKKMLQTKETWQERVEDNQLRKGWPATPSFKDYYAISLALTIIHERKHYLQSLVDPELGGPSGCSKGRPRLELEAHMAEVRFAEKMYEKFETLEQPRKSEMLTALDWVMFDNLGYDTFSGYMVLKRGNHWRDRHDFHMGILQERYAVYFGDCEELPVEDRALLLDMLYPKPEPVPSVPERKNVAVIPQQRRFEAAKAHII